MGSNCFLKLPLPVELKEVNRKKPQNIQKGKAHLFPRGELTIGEKRHNKPRLASSLRNERIWSGGE
jgi:hypothetical protein